MQPGEGLGETFLDRRGGLPSQLLPRERTVERASLELSRAGRPVLRRELRAGRPLAGVEQLEHVRLPAGADVEGLAVAVVCECAEVGVDHVADVDVVTRLRAVAEDEG